MITTYQSNSGDTPVFEIPQNQKNYIGKVVKCFEDNDGDERNYKVQFNILGLPIFESGHEPVAIPLGASTQRVKQDDLIMVWDICEFNSGLHSFFYEPINEERFTGLKNYDNVIDMTKVNKAYIKLPGMEITVSRGGDEDAHDAGSNDIGNVDIKWAGTGAHITCDNNGALNIKAKGTITINTPPSSPSFCVITECPYTGVPHTSNVVSTNGVTI